MLSVSFTLLPMTKLIFQYDLGAHVRDARFYFLRGNVITGHLSVIISPQSVLTRATFFPLSAFTWLQEILCYHLRGGCLPGPYPFRLRGPVVYAPCGLLGLLMLGPYELHVSSRSQLYARYSFQPTLSKSLSVAISARSVPSTWACSVTSLFLRLRTARGV